VQPEADKQDDQLKPQKAPALLSAVDPEAEQFDQRTMSLGRWIWNLPGLIMILAVRIYQLTLSPWLGRNCRFHPSCSRYFIQSVQKYGAIKGGFRGVMRICRCHPWHPGGYDPP
jgi:uncharacterized protein